jgi:hypothetical protein
VKQLATQTLEYPAYHRIVDIGSIKAGFTGTRKGLTEKQRHDLWHRLQRGVIEVHHGDCLGADCELDQMSRAMNIRRTIHPPDVDTLRAFCGGERATVLEPLPYLTRNRAIVDACDILLAAPETREEQRRSGTWATIRYAMKQKKRVEIFFPD